MAWDTPGSTCLSRKKSATKRVRSDIPVDREDGGSVRGPPESVERERQPFGRITVANCDCTAGADAQLAIEMAARAVSELS